MFNKNDPLISSVTKVMQENQAIRDAENAVNEAYGITDKRQLPFNLHSEYDALVQEALTGKQRNIDVSSPGNPGKPDGKLTRDDFKALQVMKMKNSLKKPMDEQSLDETSKEKAGKYTKAAANDLADKTDPNYSFMTDKDEDQVERETENRRKGIQRAVKIMVKEKAIKEERHKKVVRNILEKMRAKAGMEEEVVQEAGIGPAGAPGGAAQQQAYVDRKRVQAIAQTSNPTTTATVSGPVNRFRKDFGPAGGGPQDVAGRLKVTPPPALGTGPKTVNIGGLNPDAGKDAAVARMQAQRSAVRTGPDAAMAPKTGMMAPKVAAKPAAPATTTVRGPTSVATIQGPMKSGYQAASVKTADGQTYKGSVVNSGKQGVKIQNFGSGAAPMGPKGKVNE